MKQALKSNQTWCKQYTMKNFIRNIFLNIIIGVEYLNEKKGKSGCDNIGFVVFELNSLKKDQHGLQKRFTIQLSYLIKNVVRLKISPKNASIR